MMATERWFSMAQKIRISAQEFEKRVRQEAYRLWEAGIPVFKKKDRTEAIERLKDQYLEKNRCFCPHLEFLEEDVASLENAISAELAPERARKDWDHAEIQIRSKFEVVKDAEVEALTEAREAAA